MARFFAWLVHAYTASGAVLALLGLVAVDRGEFKQAFLIMFAATVIDGTDGWLARLARVKDRVPELDGARLDDIVDYLTFVLLPAILMVRAGHLPHDGAISIAAAVLLASAYGFRRTDAKTTDYFFTGFPSYWNIVALYLHLAGLPPVVNAAIVLVLCAAVFVPIGYIYPSRTPVLRGLTLSLLVAWGGVLLWMLWRMPAGAGGVSPLTSVPGEVVWGSLAFPAYYIVLSLVLHSRR
jgi:phosphatidylcholine synthase